MAMLTRSIYWLRLKDWLWRNTLDYRKLNAGVKNETKQNT